MRGSSGLHAKANESQPAPVSRQSMRAFIDALDRSGALCRIPQPVNREFEIAACLVEADDGPALQFDRVAGHSMPVIGNLLNSLGRFAEALEVTPATLQAAIVRAIDSPLQHRLVSSAPCQELAIASPVLMDELPIPRFFEHESGPYITAGCIVAKDRLSGAINLSIARLMPLGGNRAFIGIAPNHHLARDGARGTRARREARHCGHNRQSPGGAGGGVSLSRPGRRRTESRRCAHGRASRSRSVPRLRFTGASALRMRA